MKKLSKKVLTMLSGFGNIVKLSQNGGRKTESKKLLKKLEKSC